MLSNTIFYHAITRKIIVGFGNMFSDIRITRENTGKTKTKTLSVPLAYAPKEKWLVRLDQDPTLENNTYTTLPRLSFEITGMTYDSSRKVSRYNTITCADEDGITRTFAPAPYNININLYALTKTQEDGLQIMEQILPYFAPELVMSIKAVEQSNIIMDVPVILNSVDIQDEYDGDFETRRFITYTMGFTLKANLYGPMTDGKPITKVFINTSLNKIEGIGDIETGNITINSQDL